MFFKKIKKPQNSSPNQTRNIKRVFSFGCSGTSYRWPTWADIIGKEFDFYENWGKGGSGITHTFNSIIECDQRNQLNENDLVLIGWSAMARLDFYQFDSWVHVRYKILRDRSETSPDSDFQYPCARGYEVMAAAQIAAVHSLLKSKKVPFIAITGFAYNDASPVLQLYKTTFDEIRHVAGMFNVLPVPAQKKFSHFFKPLYDQLAGPDWPSIEEIEAGNYSVKPAIQKEIDYFIQQTQNDEAYKLRLLGQADPHWLPTEHLRIVKKYCPEVYISDKTVQWVQDIEKQVFSEQGFDYNEKCVPLNRL